MSLEMDHVGLKNKSLGQIIEITVLVVVMQIHTLQHNQEGSGEQLQGHQSWPSCIDIYCC